MFHVWHIWDCMSTVFLGLETPCEMEVVLQPGACSECVFGELISKSLQAVGTTKLHSLPLCVCSLAFIINEALLHHSRCVHVHVRLKCVQVGNGRGDVSGEGLSCVFQPKLRYVFNQSNGVCICFIFILSSYGTSSQYLTCRQ